MKSRAEKNKDPLSLARAGLMPVLFPPMHGFGIHFQDLGAFFDRHFHFQTAHSDVFTKGGG